MRSFTKLWSTLLCLLCMGTISVYADDEVELTSDMFYNWDGYGADAESVSPASVDFNIGNDVELGGGGMVCGTSTVDYLIYADLTGCTKMLFEGTPGLVLRVLLNRQESNSGPLVEKQPTLGDDGKAELDLTEFAYVHLNAIKVNWGGSGKVNSIKLVRPSDPLASYKENLKKAIAKGKMIKELAYTDATFATLTAKIADGETALAADDATAESLTNATTDINNAIAALALKDGFTSLQDVPFGTWNGWGADAEMTQQGTPAWVLFEATGQSYGDPSVNAFADVSAYDKLYIAVVSGTPRILLNRDADNGQWNEDEAQSHLIDNTKGGWSAKYFTTENGIVTVDLKQLAKDKGFAHLTAIKSFDNNVISGLYLYKETVAPIVPAYGTIWEDGEKAEDGDFMSIQMDAAYFKGLAKENDTIRVSFTNVGQAAAARRVIHDGKIQLTDGDNILAELSEIKVGATSVDFALTQDMVAKIEAAANVFVRYQYMTVTKVELLEYAVPAPPAPEIADGTYYIYNVAAQKYLAAGASWGTHAVVNAAGLDYTVALADGKYTLDSQVSNGGANHFLNGEWNDGAAFGWTIEKVAEGVFTISNGEKFLAAGEGDLVSLVDEATEAAQWEFVAAADRNAAQMATLAAATEENGVDATFFIKGADFNRNDLRNAAWQATKSGGNQTIAGPNGDRQTYGCESWNNTFDVNQTIENLPEGVYEFSIAGYGTNGTTYIYANETEMPFVNTTGAANFGAALDAIANGEYTGNTTGKVTVISGTLKIGVKRTEQVGQDWAVFDNARLTYYGPVPANEYKTAYENALAAAREALTDEAYAAVTGDEKTALEQAIATYTTVEDTKDAYVTAATALTEATSAFKAAKTAYEELNNAEVSMANVLFPYASAEKKTAAETATTAVATSAADATAKTAALLKAYRQYAESSALLEGVEGATNFTEYIVNPKADEAIAEPWVVVKGEGSGGSLGTLSNEPWTDGEDNSTHSYFDGGNWGGTSWDVALQQEITLPKGKYYLTVKSRAAADLSSFVVFAGETKTEMAHIGASNGLFNRGWNDASVEFELDKDSTIAIGVQGVTSSQYQWMSFSDFRLMQFPSETPGPQPEERNWIVFTEPAAAGELAPQYTNEAGDFILNYVDENDPKKITIDANNAFFGDAETQDKFTHRLKVGGKSGSKNNLTLTVPAAGMLKVYVRSASGSATDRNVVFTQDDKELYNNIVKDEDAIEVDLGGENPTKVYPVISFTVAKGQVAITYPIGALNFYGFELIETADGIQNVKAVENQGVCYDLQGRRVAKPVHGLYILNGKKVFVK